MELRDGGRLPEPLLTESDIDGVQHKLIDHIIDAKRVIAIVPMGGGKTMMGATAGKELLEEDKIDQMWVFAPKRVARNVWPTDLTMWAHLNHLTVSVVVGTPQQRLKAMEAKADIYVINFDNLPWLKTVLKKKRLPARTLLIIDELSRLRNATGRQAKAAEYVAKNTEYRLGMTGTPKPKGHLGLFMQARLIKGEEVWEGSYTKWRAENFETVDYDGHQWEVREGYRELLEAQFAKAAYAISEEEMGAANIEPLIHPVLVDIPKAAMRAHDEALKKWLLKLPEHKVKNLLESSAVGMGKARQIASGFVYDEDGVSRKVHAAKLEMMEELLDDLGEPAMIAYDYLPERDALLDMMPGARVIGGGVSDKEADRTIAMWKAGDLDRLLIHPQSAGHGLNIQSGGRYLFWFTAPWDLELWRQTNKRLARRGQTKPVHVYPLFAQGTVEEHLVWPRLQGRGEEEDNLKRLIRQQRA